MKIEGWRVLDKEHATREVLQQTFGDCGGVTPGTTCIRAQLCELMTNAQLLRQTHSRLSFTQSMLSGTEYCSPKWQELSTCKKLSHLHQHLRPR